LLIIFILGKRGILYSELKKVLSDKIIGLKFDIGCKKYDIKTVTVVLKHGMSQNNP